MLLKFVFQKIGTGQDLFNDSASGDSNNRFNPLLQCPSPADDLEYNCYDRNNQKYVYDITGAIGKKAYCPTNNQYYCNDVK